MVRSAKRPMDTYISAYGDARTHLKTQSVYYCIGQWARNWTSWNDGIFSQHFYLNDSTYWLQSTIILSLESQACFTYLFHLPSLCLTLPLVSPQINPIRLLVSFCVCLSICLFLCTFLLLPFSLSLHLLICLSQVLSELKTRPRQRLSDGF